MEFWTKSRMRFDPQRKLSRRDAADLPYIGEQAEAGQEPLLDTCVYIDGLQGRAPDVVGEMLNVRLSNHSTVAVQELMHTVGVLDPADPGIKDVIRQIGDCSSPHAGRRKASYCR